MVDLASEQLVGMGDAMRRLPLFRGKPPHLSTGIRWATVGVVDANGNRVKLEACRVGHRWLTSIEALQRFVERLNVPATPCERPNPTIRTERHRRRDVERAHAACAAAGI